MIGHSNKGRFESMVRETDLHSLARELRTIDIHIVAAEQPHRAVSVFHALVPRRPNRFLRSKRGA